MGFLTAGEDAGAILGPVLAGFLWTQWGVAVLLLSRVAVALVSEVYTARLERRQRQRSWPSPPTRGRPRHEAPAAGRGLS
jgi:hypothetical protein